MWFDDGVLSGKLHACGPTPAGAPLFHPTRRRIVPGEYVAVDPKGRACMVAALEKSKFVYVLNRDNDARLTISSPLEVGLGVEGLAGGWGWAAAGDAEPALGCW